MDSRVEKHNKRIRTSAHLPDDAWSLIFDKLKNKVDRDSFGLTCHNFLDIQSSSRKHLTHDCRFFESIPATHDSLIFNILSRFRQLVLLSLKRCWGLSDSDLMPLQMYGSKLQTLNLSCGLCLTHIGLSYVASGCPLLSVVNLDNCCDITDYGLQILTESCKSLKHVYLSLCTKITDNGIQCLTQNCRQPTKLGISRCKKILGEGFQGVSPTLAGLEAKYCSFDSKGISAILSGGGLEYLNCGIEYPNSPSPLSFKDPWKCDLAAIGFGYGAHIKILSLKNCKFVEDATITKIAEGCPLLQEWNLSGCDKITDLGWQSIGFNCQNLEILHVDRCKNLSKRGFEALVEGCVRLSVIYMASCRQISHDWIRKFMQLKNNVEIKYEESRQIITPNWAFTSL